MTRDEKARIFALLDVIDTKFDALREEKSEQTRILSKLDDRIDNIDRVMIQNTASLQEHMRRTELAEKNLAIMGNEAKTYYKKMDYVEGGLKGVGLLGVIVSIAAGMVKVFTFFIS